MPSGQKGVKARVDSKLKGPGILKICISSIFRKYKHQKYQKYQHTLVLLKPSAKRIISAIMAESGTTMDIGRNILFKLSGSSVLPA